MCFFQALLNELNDCCGALERLKEILSTLDPLLQSHESASLKQEVIGLEFRLEALRDQIGALVTTRKVIVEHLEILREFTAEIEERVLKVSEKDVNTDELEVSREQIEPVRSK